MTEKVALRVAERQFWAAIVSRRHVTDDLGSKANAGTQGQCHPVDRVRMNGYVGKPAKAAQSLVEIDPDAASNVRRIFQLLQPRQPTEKLAEEGRRFRPALPRLPRSRLHSLLGDRDTGESEFCGRGYSAEAAQQYAQGYPQKNNDEWTGAA